MRIVYYTLITRDRLCHARLHNNSSVRCSCTGTHRFTACRKGGALFFEGPTLATVVGANFSANSVAASSFGSSLALSAVNGINTLVLSSPSFTPAAMGGDEAMAGPLADIYVDGNSIQRVFVVTPKTNVMMIGPGGNTWPAQPTTETPPLPPAQGFVQPKVLSGREAWIAAAAKVRAFGFMIS